MIFSITDLCLKNYAMKFLAHITGFPAVAAPSENANSAYVQFSQSHQEVACCGIDMPISPTQQASQKTASSLVSIPKAFDSSCFPVIFSLPFYVFVCHSILCITPFIAEFH